MAVDIAVLATELATDPAGLGYAPLLAVANDQGVADLLNRPNITDTGPIPLRTFGRWLSEQSNADATKSRWELLLAGQVNLALAPAARGSAFALIETFKSGTSEQLDFSAATGGSQATHERVLLNAVVSAGVLNAADRNRLVNALAGSKISRAEVLFGRGTVVTASDVGAAR